MLDVQKIIKDGWINIVRDKYTGYILIVKIDDINYIAIIEDTKKL